MKDSRNGGQRQITSVAWVNEPRTTNSFLLRLHISVQCNFFSVLGQLIRLLQATFNEYFSVAFAVLVIHFE